ncbi:MAG: glycosyltransferase family 39 protein [Rhodocyclaceae bacterium]
MSLFAPEGLSPRARLLLLLLPLFVFMLNLAGAPLFDVDEGAFSEATREMFVRHDFISTWLNGSPRFDKPILVYWCQAFFVWLFGPNEWSFRLPSAIAAAVWCHAAGLFASQRAGKDAGWMAAIVGMTSIGVFAIGRAATADALLNMLLALALFDAWRHLETGARAPLLRSYLWIALGVLTKGPIALLVPGATTMLYCLFSGRLGAWLRSVFNPMGWVILIAIALPWYAAEYHVHGRDFIDGFFLKHNVERFSGPLEGHSGSAFYYVLMVPVLLLPWLAWLVAAVGHLASDLRDPLRRFLWVWCLFVVVFFSLSGTKLPHYALYGCTPLFVLIALHRETIRRAWVGALPALVLLIFLTALPALLQHGLDAGWIKDPYYVAQLGRVANINLVPYYSVLGVALCAALFVIAAPRIEVWRRQCLIALFSVLTLALAVTPLVGELLQGPVKRTALAARDIPGDAVTWNFNVPSFAVYREQVTPARQPVSGQLAITRADRLPADVPVDVLRREGGVVLVRVR